MKESCPKRVFLVAFEASLLKSRIYYFGCLQKGGGLSAASFPFVEAGFGGEGADVPSLMREKILSWKNLFLLFLIF